MNNLQDFLIQVFGLSDNEDFEKRKEKYNQILQEEQRRIELHKQTYTANIPLFMVKPDTVSSYLFCMHPMFPHL